MSDDLLKLAELRERATAGEWTGVKTFLENGRAYLCASPRSLIFAADDDERIQPGTATEANADFCAAASSITPARLRELAGMEAELNQLRGSDLTVVELEAELDVARKKIAALLAERREREAKLAGWRPISETPPNDRKFLAFTADFMHGVRFNEKVQEARWIGDSPDDPAGCFMSDNGQMITHWMPLPPAPNTKGT